MATIRISNLDMTARGQKISNFMLTVHDKEVFSICGDASSGKGALVDGLLGLSAISFGTIAVDDVEVQDLAPNQRQITRITDGWGLFPHLNVRGNLGYGLRFKKMAKNEIQERLERYLRHFQLFESQNLYPVNLNPREQFRLTLARAAITEPNLIILEEPFKRYDFHTRQEFVNLARDYQQDFGLTLLFLTESPLDVMGISDHMAVMRGGYLEQSGRTQEIYANPVNTHVAANTGEINILKAQVVMGGDFYMLSTKVGGLNLKSAERLRPEMQVEILIRPEFTKVVPLGKTEDARNVFSGQISHMRYMGAFQYLSLKTEDQVPFLSVQNIEHSFDLNEDVDVILTRDEYPIVKLQ